MRTQTQRIITTLLSLAALCLPLQAATYYVNDEEVEVDGSGYDSYYNPVAVKEGSYMAYTYLFVQGPSGGSLLFDTIYSYRASSPQGTYSNKVQITPNGHSYAGECTGFQKDVWGLGDLITDSYPQYEQILFLNHACDTDTGQHRFFYTVVSAGTRDQGFTKIADTSKLSNNTIIFNPAVFEATNDVNITDGGVIGIFFTFTEGGTGLYTGYMFHNLDTGETSLLKSDGSYVTVDDNDDYEFPSSTVLGRISALGGLVTQANTRTLAASSRQPKGRAYLVTSSPYGTAPNVHMREIKFNTSNYHFHSLISGTVNDYEDIDFTGTCTGPRLHAPEFTALYDALALFSTQSNYFWTEDGDSPDVGTDCDRNWTTALRVMSGVKGTSPD